MGFPSAFVTELSMHKILKIHTMTVAERRTLISGNTIWFVVHKTKKTCRKIVRSLKVFCRQHCWNVGIVSIEKKKLIRKCNWSDNHVSPKSEHWLYVLIILQFCFPYSFWHNFNHVDCGAESWSNAHASWNYRYLLLSTGVLSNCIAARMMSTLSIFANFSSPDW